MYTKILISNLEQPCLLEKFLKKNTSIPYAMIKKLFRKRLILVDGKRIKSDKIINNNQLIEIKTHLNLDTTHEKILNKNSTEYKNLVAILNQNIIYKDQNIIAFNKPNGVAVQGGSKIKISIDDVLDEFKFDYKNRPKLVHRLDKNTSGVLIIARNNDNAEKLTAKFKNKEISKAYLALLQGRIKKPFGIVKINLDKKLISNEEIMAVSETGKLAVTRYKILDKFSNNLTLIEYYPETGRKHQLRVTSQYLGCPIIGDKKYGDKKSNLNLDNQLFLHCRNIAFKMDNKTYSINAELPEHFSKVIKLRK